MIDTTLIQPACPIVNLNGSSAEALLAQNAKARQHLYNTLLALYDMMPHGRDYIGHPERCETARREHMARIQSLQTVMFELEAIALNIHRQKEH